MTLSAASLVFEGLVSVLLVAVIFYAIKLNSRIVGLRAREAELQDLITRFNDASDQAEASAATLKSAGIEAEGKLRSAVGRAQALRDDLAFMVERGDGIANKVERSIDATRRVPAAAASGPATRAAAKPPPAAEPPPVAEPEGSSPRERTGSVVPVTSWQPGQAASPASDAASKPASDAAPEPASDAAPEPAAAENSRSEAERELLRALRTAGVRR